ncbi:Ral GTPase-activating protein subunit alpha-2 [Acipenser ruthenus]|uniref:Ral GTPase-activating protein subunit alpha-2 n=1 Tax=Acipenser ruthenus TaxID=7906 RepID=A0A444TWS2_ACIRT|nr:Ral GTPase-activating protein subunit alpha-2 [Acipenser ruthenus]
MHMGNKSQREELDSILFLFEIRCEGIRLFLQWIQALQSNCLEEQFLIFACLVPGFPTVTSSRGPCTLDTIITSSYNTPLDAKVVPEEITPLVPAVAGEKIAEDQTCYFLQIVLKDMVIQASSLEWRNRENKDTGFRFLFTLFKKYYLPHLFPSFTKLTNVYKPLLEVDESQQGDSPADAEPLDVHREQQQLNRSSSTSDIAQQLSSNSFQGQKRENSPNTNYSDSRNNGLENSGTGRKDVETPVDVLNTVIRYCSPRFFFLGLPGFTMLVGDFISAAARILGSDALEAPRIEAQTILGSLVCFPNLYQQMPLLQPVPGSTEKFTGNEDIKDYFINILLKNARNEPSEGARCIAVCSLGVWICEELAQCTSHPHVKDAINVMGVTLKLGNKVVAHVACDIFHLLVCHWQNLQKYEASLPKKITEIFVATIAFLLPSAEHSTMEADKKVLHCCVHGSNLYTQQSHYLLSLADLSATDYDPFLSVGNVRNSEPPQCHTSVDFGNLLTVAEEKKRRNMELIPLTARMIMTHLVNHLSHHPLSGGPAILHSLISENHDNDYVESSELSSEVFKSPNLQLFVFNDSTLVSYLQIPAEKTGDGEPHGAAADVRVIVRDISGKYSWDGGVLYGPLDGQSSSSCKDQHIKVPWGSARPRQKVHPMSWDSEGNSEEGQDVLDNLLENLGSSSPECLSQQQGKLNDPAPPPLGMSHEQEHTIMEAILRQSSQEEAHVKRWHSDISMKVGSQKEPAPQESKAPFYFCRLLLNDLGMNSWDRRKSFHLLKKNSKLLRELKNLDSRQCRETHKIAVFYIGDGQEDKCSILSNTGGSQAYEDFVSGLGWEVDLSTHCGFMGGLQRNGSTGQTAPYYSTSTVEVIFHVSTRMPSDPDDSLTRKLRHLGNDEVHIVWSEHTRDYRRGIIPTDFGDVLIIIYPMKNQMFFVQIMKKPQIPFFGPLFDGAIVTATLLPSLVRATCINASRVVKSRLTLYQSLYPFTCSLSGSASAELPVAVGTDSTDQVSPTMPCSTRSRVPGKLRRSASAISKSSN